MVQSLIFHWMPHLHVFFLQTSQEVSFSRDWFKIALAELLPRALKTNVLLQFFESLKQNELFCSYSSVRSFLNFWWIPQPSSSGFSDFVFCWTIDLVTVEAVAKSAIDSEAVFASYAMVDFLMNQGFWSIWAAEGLFFGFFCRSYIRRFFAYYETSDQLWISFKSSG